MAPLGSFNGELCRQQLQSEWASENDSEHACISCALCQSCSCSSQVSEWVGPGWDSMWVQKWLSRVVLGS